MSLLDELHKERYSDPFEKITNLFVRRTLRKVSTVRNKNVNFAMFKQSYSSQQTKSYLLCCRRYLYSSNQYTIAMDTDNFGDTLSRGYL